jgi:hypothetical protein
MFAEAFSANLSLTRRLKILFAPPATQDRHSLNGSAISNDGQENADGIIASETKHQA